ncbi:MAG TPA: DUF6624 domain-containing protein [Gemmatimonadales bacterium]|nr:DUF6624 domain-containing protein [Gemmatimonadales bacterium]
MAQEWDAIGRELLHLLEEDERVRAELAADGSLFQGYHPRMQAVHDANAARLAVILDSHGWPGGSQVGEEGGQAAWLIVQHAIAQPAFQRSALGLLQAAVRRGEAPALHAAMLEDRILSLEGRPQRYGTQFDWDAHGRMSPLPLEDPDGVDRRRQKVGLGPLDQALRAQRATIDESAERPPHDWESRQREMEAWCRKVGWRK